MACLRLVPVGLVVLLSACSQDYANPFGSSLSQPPGPDAAIIYVSAAWATEPGQPRELFAINADGSGAERLTSCTQEDPPCDVLVASSAPDGVRVAVVRGSPTGDPGAAALYFMDLQRSVEALIVERRQVQGVDYAPDGSFLVYSAEGPADTPEELYFTRPNGTENELLTTTPQIRERSARIDPLSRTAVYERIDETGKGQIYEFQARQITAGGPGSEPLPDSPYIVGSDADPDYSPDGRTLVFRRLTGTGNGGLGTWDLMRVALDGSSLAVLVSGPLYRGAPDWGEGGIVFVETDAAADESRLVVIQPDGSGRQVLRTERAGYALGSPRWLP
jgi:Tol biopolymer transport system component